MKRIIIFLLALIFLVAAVLILITLSRPAPRAVELLPDSTLLFVEAPNFKRCREKFAATAAGALWQDPEVQTTVRRSWQELREAMGRGGSTAQDDFLASLALNAMQGEVFLAVTPLTLLPAVRPGIVLGVDVKRQRVQTALALDQVDRKILAEHPEAMCVTKRYLGVKYSLWEFKPGFPVCHAMLQSLVVFTLGEDTMRDMITRYTRQFQSGTGTLATSSKFRNVLAHLPPDSDVRAYLNVEQITSLVGMLMAYSRETAGTFQQLARIQAIGNGLRFVDGGVQDIGYTAYAKPDPKPALASRRATLALTTPRTALYWVSTTDLAADYQSLMDASVANETFANRMTQFERALKRRGVRVPADLLANLGPEIAVLGSWRPGARTPEFAFVSPLRSAAKTRATLDAVADVLKELALGDDDQDPWEETAAEGAALRTVRIGAGTVAPTYVTTDQFLIIANTPDYARELLRQAQQPQPTLATSAEYQRASARLPTNGCSYTYCDLRAVFEPAYNFAKAELRESVTNENFAATALPPGAAIARHLFPFASATVAEPLQTTTTTFSPFGRSVVTLAGVASGVWTAAKVFHLDEEWFNGLLPKSFSNTDAIPAPRENRTEASQTPSPR